MSDLMRPLSFSELIHRIFTEYRSSHTIFAVEEGQFFRKSTGRIYKVFGEDCGTILGPAAGPHTQLAQNIVTAYLCGARFIELKTVQILDTLDIAKPCIDCRDECFNTEWSSEFTVPKAYDEYLKAWFALHLLEAFFFQKKDFPSPFIFNMSVGYDLEGIKNPKIDYFIESLKDASEHPLFLKYRDELKRIIKGNQEFASLAGLEERISPKICSQLTLSTMHGCPPAEIEQIVSYMLTEKQLNIFVKLNPTLLGYDFVRDLIANAGYEYIRLSPEAFARDLSWNEAVPMLRRLKTLAEEHHRFFGVKLTNTLGTINELEILPGDEMYMSGRLLYPLSLNVAARISREFSGGIPISFSGGLNRITMEEVLKTGIAPVTAATEFLKPGGYRRMAELARFMETLEPYGGAAIDVKNLEELARRSLSDDNHWLRKRTRGYTQVKTGGALPLYDCFLAPCQAACPIGQDIPEYIALTAAGKYGEAASLIYEKNPLPFITGHICDHQCQYQCTRRDYEGPVEIREMKKIALEKGFELYRQSLPSRKPLTGPKSAVIGAGPAGLAAASFLARKGFPVSVFDENDKAGGVVEHNIPEFRIPRETIEKDVAFVESLGVDIRLNYTWDFSLESLMEQGFCYIFLALGADRIRPFPVTGDSSRLLPSFTFINRFNRNRDSLKLGRHVVVAGAGDTAMDSARAALKVKGVEKVTLVYRRSERQMPATEEEYEECLAENISFLWLRNPECLNDDGTVTLRVMKLGEPDESGRRQAVPTDVTERIPCDTLIPSIGERVDREELSAAGLPADSRGRVMVDGNNETERSGVFIIGDGRTGPSTIVGAMADARKAVNGLLRREGRSPVGEPSLPSAVTDRVISLKKGLILEPLDRKIPYDAESFARREGERCLSCDIICEKCVDVCPNRANIAIELSGMKNSRQIIHLDAYCNECGNCATFCPWDGRPYRDKITLFSRKEDFDDSRNGGFFIEGTNLFIRSDGEVYEGKASLPADHTLIRLIEEIGRNYSYLLGPVED